MDRSRGRGRRVEPSWSSWRYSSEDATKTFENADKQTTEKEDSAPVATPTEGAVETPATAEEMKTEEDSAPVATPTEGAVETPETADEMTTEEILMHLASQIKSSVDDKKPLREKREPPELETHHLKFKLRDDHPGVLEYHVTITPPISSFGLVRSLMDSEESRKILGVIKHFDGETLFLPTFLPHDMTYETRLKEDPNTLFKVCVTFTRIRPKLECADFYLALLRQSLHWLEYKQIDGLFCNINMRKSLRKHRMEIWQGIRLKAGIKKDDLIIKVGTGNVMVGKKTVLDHLSTLKGTPVEVQAKFDQLMANTKVFTKYDLKCYLIDRVKWDITPETEFWYGGETVSFKNHLEQKHKVSITHVGAPMLISLGKRLDEKLRVRYVTLVPELCHIIGIPDVMKSNEEFMTDVSLCQDLLNEKRQQHLTTFFNRLLGDVRVAKFLDTWGLRLQVKSIRLSVAAR